MSTEWLKIDQKELEYHLSQYARPKAYTLEVLDIFKKAGLDQSVKSVLDFGCGGGAVTNLFAKQYPSITFKGVDINSSYVALANEKSEPNATYAVFDLYNEDDLLALKTERFNCILSFQTLSWLKDYDQFLKLMSVTLPDYCVITSLFYDGPVEAQIKIKDITRSMGDINYRESYYNIYSLDLLKSNLEGIGYCIDQAIPFEIGFDLPKPDDGSMSTYTETLANGKRLQISGPILMNWFTIIIKKN